MYYSDESHFRNCVNKVVEERNEEHDKIRLYEIINNVYEYDRCFHTKKTSSIYFEIKKKKDIPIDIIVNEFEKTIQHAPPYKAMSEKLKTHKAELSEEYIKIAERIGNVSGIYKLFDKDKNLIYVGKSTSSLYERIIGSSNERQAEYCKCCEIKSKAETCIYELYYINMLMPPLNKDCKHGDGFSFELEPLKFCDFIQIYKDTKEERKRKQKEHYKQY